MTKQQYKNMSYPASELQGIASNFQRWRHFLHFAAEAPEQSFFDLTWNYTETPEAEACAEYIENHTHNEPILYDSEIREDFDAKLKEIESVCAAARFPASDDALALQNYCKHHLPEITSAFEKDFGTIQAMDFPHQITAVAQQLAERYWNDNQDELLYACEALEAVDDEYDSEQSQEVFCEAAAESAAYALLSRCGKDTSDSFDYDSYLCVLELSASEETAVALGNAVHHIVETVLRTLDAATAQNGLPN